MKSLNLFVMYLFNNKTTKTLLYSTFLLFIYNTGIAQEYIPYTLGNETNFTQNLISNRSHKQLSNEPNLITLKLSDTETLSGKINVSKGTTENYLVIGSIENNDKASFSISKDNGIIEGEIILIDQKKAYQYYSDDNDNVLIKEIDINKLLCVDLQKSNLSEKSLNSDPLLEVAQAQAEVQDTDLQSLPESNYVIYLDFDGELVTETSWISGGTIDAVSSGFSDEEIITIWKIMTEDFRPFNLNVTTNRDVYETTPINQRIMCIFTPTDTAAPGSGGVAYINSFSNTRVDNPCWVYSSRATSAGGTGSHEIGHALGLSHDGTNDGVTYYGGHGSWCPIMGGTNRSISQWSKGEYDNADNDEDDLAIIAGSRNAFGYRLDDHGDTISEASELIVDANGLVNSSENTGLIATTKDKDVLSFITSGGEVSFNFEPDPLYPNLNIQARILNAIEEEIITSSPNDDLSASISTTLTGGTYFIEIDGVGEDDLSSGYSDYACIGLYSISGAYEPGNNNQPPVANFEASQECDQVNFTSTSINTVNSYAWDFGDGNTSIAQNPDHTYANEGTYTVSLTVTNDIGTSTNTKTNFANIIIASIPEPINQSICKGESATINLNDSSAGYIWYDKENSGTIITTGNSFNTPELTENKTYYVSATTKAIITATTGMQNIDENSGNIHNGGQNLIFDVNEPILLNKARVFANGSGNRTLNLSDADGEILASKEINIPDGESVIDINLSIPAGNNLQIGFSQGSNLFRSNEGTNYPYEIDDIISIKSSTAGNNPTRFYYYLYDWEITTLGDCETSDRALVTITVSDYPKKPLLTLDSETNIISVNEDFFSYQWYFNNEIIPGATAVNYFAEKIGSYNVEVSNASNCSSISDTININSNNDSVTIDPIEVDDNEDDDSTAVTPIEVDDNENDDSTTVNPIEVDDNEDDDSTTVNPIEVDDNEDNNVDPIIIDDDNNDDDLIVSVDPTIITDENDDDLIVSVDPTIIIDGNDNDLIVPVNPIIVDNNEDLIIGNPISIDDIEDNAIDITADITIFKIYPVPTKNILYIDGLTDMKEINSIRVINALGQIIITHNNIVPSIDTSFLQEGIYFLVINDIISRKFIKK